MSSYFTTSGKRVILLHGFIKKTAKTPKREINIALKRMKEIQNG
ncbi:MAG: type II toxin-antitoxin system RelE/ParE family toxin [bacterium]|nr:type II toxin-antitoxin system RelE/ParE family toxin [bacterium]